MLGNYTPFVKTVANNAFCGGIFVFIAMPRIEMHQSYSFFYLTFDQWQHLHASSEVRTDYARRFVWTKITAKSSIVKNLEVTLRPISMFVSFVCYLIYGRYSFSVQIFTISLWSSRREKASILINMNTNSPRSPDISRYFKI